MPKTAHIKDFDHLTKQWDITLCQLGMVNPFRIAVFTDEILTGEDCCISNPYLPQNEREITLLGYFPVTSWSDETFEANAEVANPSDLELFYINRPDNHLILIDVSSSQIVLSGNINRWHKYPSNNSRVFFTKGETPLNYYEFIEESKKAGWIL